MSLNADFTASVLQHMQERWNKAYDIASNLLELLNEAAESVRKKKISTSSRTHWQTDYTHYDEECGFNFEEKTGSCYINLQAYRAGEVSSNLTIQIATCGTIDVSLQTSASDIHKILPSEYSNATNTFDFDTYTPEAAVAKILSVIKQQDEHDFGPLVTEIVKRLAIPGTRLGAVSASHLAHN